MGTVIEEVDATVIPEGENAQVSAQDSPKPAPAASKPLPLALHHWTRRQLRVKAD